MQDRMKCRSNEGVSPSHQNGIEAGLLRLGSNLDRDQAFLGFLKHLPERLSRHQAAIVCGVSVDLRRRNRAQRGSRIGGRLIRVRVRVDDLDGLPADLDGTFTASLVGPGEGSWLRRCGTGRAR